MSAPTPARPAWLGPEEPESVAQPVRRVAWSCISAGGIEAVELPFDVAEAVIFADRDPPRRGWLAWP